MPAASNMAKSVFPRSIKSRARQLISQAPKKFTIAKEDIDS